MTKEEIEALLKDILNPLLDTALNTKLAGLLEESFQTFNEHFEGLLEDRLKPPEDSGGKLDPEDLKPDPEDTPEDDTKMDAGAKALLARLKVLEQQAADREAADSSRKFGEALRAQISPKNPLHSTVVEELLKNRFSGLVEKSGDYYSSDGKKLSELVEGFFGSVEGQHFLPPSGRSGDGSEDRKSASTPTKQTGEPTLEQMLKNLDL